VIYLKTGCVFNPADVGRSMDNRCLPGGGWVPWDCFL